MPVSSCLARCPCSVSTLRGSPGGSGYGTIATKAQRPGERRLHARAHPAMTSGSDPGHLRRDANVRAPTRPTSIGSPGPTVYWRSCTASCCGASRAERRGVGSRFDAPADARACFDGPCWRRSCLGCECARGRVARGGSGRRGGRAWRAAFSRAGLALVPSRCLSLAASSRAAAVRFRPFPSASKRFAALARRRCVVARRVAATSARAPATCG